MNRRISRERKRMLKSIAARNGKQKPQSPPLSTPEPIAAENPTTENMGSENFPKTSPISLTPDPTTMPNETEGVASGQTNPNHVPPPAPNVQMGGGEIDPAEILKMMQQQVAQVEAEDMTPARLADRYVIQNCLGMMFGLWAKSTNDPGKLLSDIEGRSLAEAVEIVLNKHWPGLLMNWAAELNLLSQIVIIVLPRIGRGNSEPDPRRPEAHTTANLNGQDFYQASPKAHPGQPAPIAA